MTHPRRKRLTATQEAQIRDWVTSVKALGRSEEAIQLARREWQLKRRALLRRKEMAHRLGISESCLTDYIYERHNHA